MNDSGGSIDVSEKDVTLRRAVAQSILVAPPEAIQAIRQNALPKKDPLATARAAGLLAAKRTASLIPHCHPIALTGVAVAFDFADVSVTARCEVTAVDRTGPEMEALCGAAVAALALYDTIKGICRGARVTQTLLVEKDGGKSGHWRAEQSDG